jgi:hypothetical protein
LLLARKKISAASDNKTVRKYFSAPQLVVPTKKLFRDGSTNNVEWKYERKILRKRIAQRRPKIIKINCVLL